MYDSDCYVLNVIMMKCIYVATYLCIFSFTSSLDLNGET